MKRKKKDKQETPPPEPPMPTFAPELRAFVESAAELKGLAESQEKRRAESEEQFKIKLDPHPGWGRRVEAKINVKRGVPRVSLYRPPEDHDWTIGQSSASFLSLGPREAVDLRDYLIRMFPLG